MSNPYSDLFAYNDGSSEIPAEAFRISPSGVEKFFSDKVQWYTENLLGGPKKFTGSTSTVNGTCVHAAAEVVSEAKRTNTPHDSALLDEAVEEHIATYDDDEDFDTDKIRGLWRTMAEPLIRDFVLPANTVSAEGFIKLELLPGIFVGGSYDAITSSAPTDTWEDIKAGKHAGRLTVRDYKTASKKPSSFSYAYKLQAYTYAYVLTKLGIPIDEVELCFVVQATKTLPVRTVNFTLPFDEHAKSFIEGILLVIADSAQAFKALPEWRYLLMGDYRQKIT